MELGSWVSLLRWWRELLLSWEGFLEEALSTPWSLPPAHTHRLRGSGVVVVDFLPAHSQPACPEPFPLGEAVGLGGLGQPTKPDEAPGVRGFRRRPAVLCAVASWTRGAVPGAACGLAHCPVPLSTGQAFPEGAAGWGGEGVGRGGVGS